MEEWKTIEEAPNYEVSTFGRVRSNTAKSKGKILKPYINREGYNQISLRYNNKTIKRSIHRLIAKTFIPNPEDKPEVDHIDRNPKNNCVKNLRWVTPLENTDNQERGETDEKYITNNQNKILLRIRRLKIWASFDTIEEAIMVRDFILD